MMYQQLWKDIYLTKRMETSTVTRTARESFANEAEEPAPHVGVDINPDPGWQPWYGVQYFSAKRGLHGVAAEH